MKTHKYGNQWENLSGFPILPKKKKKELFCADNDYVKFFKICNMEPA